MSQAGAHKITELLVAWSGGDKSAIESLMPLVYDELRRLAHRHMNHERPGHTVQTTALVNEAYLRLVNWRDVQWQDRAHFFAVSAQMMRRILKVSEETVMQDWRRCGLLRQLEREAVQ